MTTEDRLKRPDDGRAPRAGALRIDLAAVDDDDGHGRQDAAAGRSLPERLYAARDAKGVDLYRAERDTKIRSRYLAAMERGDWRELPGSVYTKGFLRNYAQYLGLDPDEALAQWHRERGDAGSPDPEISAPRPLTAPRKPLTVGPYAVVATLMTVIVLLFAAYIGAQLFRFAKPPVVAVTQPTAAVTTAPADATSYTLRGTATAGASVEITGSGSEQPRRTTAGPDGLWSAVVDLRRGKNEFVVSARDPETGKTAEAVASLVITVPFAVVVAPTLTVDSPADGTVVENGAIPVSGKATNAVTVGVAATYVGPTTEPAAGKAAPSPPKAPGPVTVEPAEDGAFSVPLELSEGRWTIAVTATSQELKTTTVARAVTVQFKGVNLVVSIKNGRAWLKVWVDGKASEVTGPAGRVYGDGKVLTFTGKERIEVRTGQSSSTYFTLNGEELGHLSEQGNPETWLFAPPDPPVKTNRR
ncbi:MAG TPA: helix-turn-helix domain-containing protein [Candidatus Limnocylindrales bacterium]|nr:helix-turn-helix domain-containing protein [Candidatus Limnocylindrales bacterium]